MSKWKRIPIFSDIPYNLSCYFYHPEQKLGEGNVFIGVCLFTGGEYPDTRSLRVMGMPGPRSLVGVRYVQGVDMSGGYVQRGGGISREGLVCPRGWVPTPLATESEWPPPHIWSASGWYASY